MVPAHRSGRTAASRTAAARAAADGAGPDRTSQGGRSGRREAGANSNTGTGTGTDTDMAASAGDAAGLALWIQPRACADAVIGERDGLVAIRLQAPPVEGAANKALIRFLARSTGVAASRVRLLSGERGRRKRVQVEGLEPAELRRRLLALAG